MPTRTPEDNALSDGVFYIAGVYNVRPVLVDQIETKPNPNHVLLFEQLRQIHALIAAINMVKTFSNELSIFSSD